MRVHVIPKNEDVPCTRWRAWSGKQPQQALLYFNQESAAELDSSIWYIVDLAKKLKQQDPQIQPHFNIPMPGLQQYEAVAAGYHDGMYRRMFQQMLAIFNPASTGRIETRIACEFQLGTYQKNVAINRNGQYDPALYVTVFRRIVSIGRSVSPRFWYNWCPNHGKDAQPHGLEAYYPGDDVVDEIGFDFYFQSRFGTPSHAWVLAPGSGYGAQWFADFAAAHKKPWSIPEIGADSDAAAPALDQLLAWAKLKGCRWIGWWDRWEVINCQISTGALPAVGAVVRKYL